MRLLSRLGAAALREVDVGDHQPAEARDLEAALAVELRLLESGAHPVGRDSREEADSAVAAAFRDAEAGVPAPRRANARREVLGQRPHLLQTDDVGFGRAQPAQEAFPGAGAQSVDVPGDHSQTAGMGEPGRGGAGIGGGVSSVDSMMATEAET